MRRAEHICLLCNENKATQEDSHIIPKHLCKSIFGDTKKVGYILSSGADKDQKVQDSVKESYILCPGCEQSFSILETYVSNRFHNRIKNTTYSGDFLQLKTGAGLKYKTSSQINFTIFNLYIYSIVWRCSIASHRTFTNFKLTSEQEEVLRFTLAKFKSKYQDELLSLIDANNIPLPETSFMLLTSEAFTDTTNNIIVAGHTSDPYFLFLNEYALYFCFSKNNAFSAFELANNSDDSTTKIGWLTEHQFQKIKEPYLERMAKDKASNSNN